MSHTILVVDDDTALAEMAGIILQGEGYQVEFCHTGDEAFDKFNEVKADLVLLDLMLPGKDGIQICEEIKAASPATPVIMLTAKTDTLDVVAGLEAGADDYMPKPFKPAELLARIMARLRPVETKQVAAHMANPNIQEIGRLKIDIPGRVLYVDNQQVAVTPLEFDLVATMAARPREAFSREELLEKVWGYKYVSDTRLVNVHMQRLRSKIETDPENPNIVLTVRGVGYKVGQ
ncbi:MAG: MtrAB system response regulator MtrA [Micrococcaceae bacterium]